MATLFISDLHLSAAEPGVVEVFKGFLRGPARAADALIILGDLFEYWAGDDDLADPFNRDVCAHIASLADDGVAVSFMRGNRDFLVGQGFAHAARLSLLEDPVTMEINGERTLLMHGDTLCTDDTAYQAFRAQVRDAAWQAQFLSRPLAERKHIIEGLREHSETAKQEKPADIMDVSPQAVVAAFREHQCARLIHGHTHRPQCHQHEVDGRLCTRWVLSDWCAQAAYLRCDSNGIESVALVA